MAREHYVKQLEELQGQVHTLGQTVEAALETAFRTLQDGDTTTATQLVQHDQQLDAQQHQIESRVVYLLATQQPVASDLRLLTAIVAIASELERIGDYAAGIARRTSRIATRPVPLTPTAEMAAMAQAARQVLNTSLQAFVTRDEALAHALSSEEEVVDGLARRIRGDLIAQAAEDPQRIEAMIDLLEVAHALERVADRATNIGERVIFLKTNTTEELNP
ncbi:MAG: phosphate signaling complex protein PhoU [Chloroflexaceae bacterium]|jgi:phosphate transport system protein|nr:phosphate signaling complex protein PhoU [Chloroflexaceae bacterium]